MEITTECYFGMKYPPPTQNLLWCLDKRTLTPTTPVSRKLNSNGQPMLPQGVESTSSLIPTITVLIWNELPSTNASNPDLILTSTEYDDTPYTEPNIEQFAWPWGVWTDGEKLIVASTSGGSANGDIRFGGWVLIWNTFPPLQTNLLTLFYPLIEEWAPQKHHDRRREFPHHWGPQCPRSVISKRQLALEHLPD